MGTTGPTNGDALGLGTWQGNRRTAFRTCHAHTRQWFIHLRLRKGDEHPAYTADAHFSFTCRYLMYLLSVLVFNSEAKEHFFDTASNDGVP